MRNKFWDLSIKKDIRLKAFDQFIQSNKLNSTTNSKTLFIFVPGGIGDHLKINGMIRYYFSHYDKIIITSPPFYQKTLSSFYEDIKYVYIFTIPQVEYYYYSPSLTDFILKRSYTSNKIPENNSSYCQNLISLFDRYQISYLFLGWNDHQKIITPHEYYSNFDVLFYHQANLNPDIGYSHFKINRNLETELKLYLQLISLIGQQYHLVCDDERRNYLLKDEHINHNYPIFKLSNEAHNTNAQLDTIRSEVMSDYLTIIENAVDIHLFDSGFAHLLEYNNYRPRGKIHLHYYVRPTLPIDTFKRVYRNLIKDGAQILE